MDDKWRKEAIGKRIKAARECLQLSQNDVQEATGIKYSMISDFERGVREPNLANFAKLSRALKVSMNDLYFGDENVELIESAPDYGTKIVNCFTALFLCGAISPADSGDEDGYRHGGPLHVDLWQDAGSIKRLLDNLDDYRRNLRTYDDPVLYLNQLKQSAANDINSRHIED